MSSLTGNINLNRESLDLLLKAKIKVRDKLEEDELSSLEKASSILKLGDPSSLQAWLTPVLSRATSEEEVLNFFKLLVNYYRISNSLDKVIKEVSALELLLDEHGPLALASVNFDDVEVFNEGVTRIS